MSEATERGADVGRICMALALNDGADVDHEWLLQDKLDDAREVLSRATPSTAADRLAFLATMRDDIELLLAGIENPADVALAKRLRRMTDTLMRQASTETGLPESMFGPVVYRPSEPRRQFCA